MDVYADDDLISFVSSDDSLATSPVPPALSPSVCLPEVGTWSGMGELGETATEDSFAVLTDLMRTQISYQQSNPSGTMLRGQDDGPLPNNVATPMVASSSCDLAARVSVSARTASSLGPVSSVHPTDYTDARMNGSSPVGSVKNPGEEYDDGKMKRLEDMLSEMEALKVEHILEPTCHHQVSTPAPAPSPARQLLIEVEQSHSKAYHTPSTPPTYHPTQIDEDKPIVRLTGVVYDEFIAEYSSLKIDHRGALAQIDALERQLHERGDHGAGDVDSKVGLLQYQLEATKDHKAAMGNAMRQKDIELNTKDQELDVMKTKLSDTETLRKRFEQSQAELRYLRQEKTVELEEHTRVIAQTTATRDKEIAALKDALACSQTAVSEHTVRAQELDHMQLQMLKRVKKLESTLFEERDVFNKMSDEFEGLKEESQRWRPRLKEIEAKLREKTSLSDRQRNDLRHTNRRLELSQTSFQRIQAGKALNGAAHLICPSATTHLPKTVFPCMECFVNNVDCDSQTRCGQCTLKEERCARWRCSLKHINHECNEAPCRFVHDVNGWLMTQEQRPQW